MNHLRDKEYYSDLYDRITVDQCRSFEHGRITGIDFSTEEPAKQPDYSDITPLEFAGTSILLYFVAGDRYLKKTETIQDWMDRDKRKDEQLEQATLPTDVACDTCGRNMEYQNGKMFDIHGSDRVMFFFECPKGHLPHKYVYEDGTVWRKKPTPCPECDSDLGENTKEKNKELITTISCPNCSYEDTDVIDLTKKDEEESDPNFERDRQRFCMSNEVGEKFRRAKEGLNAISEHLEEMKDKEKHEKEAKRAEEIKRLTVPNIKKRLRAFFADNKLEEIKFKDLQINPKATYLPFSVEDPEVIKETERQRTMELKKAIEDQLKETN